MKIFFTSSYYGKDKYQKYYDMVIDSLENQNVEVISPEKGNYKEILSKAKRKKITDPNTLHYEAIKKGIQTSDAVVIESSHQDLQIGYEMAMATQSKKHVLCLSINEDFGKKINNPFFHGFKYNELTLDNIIEEFIQKISKEYFDKRFNFFLSGRQLEKLRERAVMDGKTPSSVLRGLIDEVTL